MRAGLPTIAVRELEIQRRENDLALATFGRGFYILDDYTPLREITQESLDEDAVLFPVKDALRYIETSRLGLVPLDKAFQGDTYYTAPNPAFGAVFTYHLKDGLKTRQERRHEAEEKADEDKTTLPYPSTDDLRAEDEENDPSIVLTVRDADGNVVQRVTGPRSKGIHRVAWDLRYPSSRPTDPDPGPSAPWDSPGIGPLALPGTYSVSLAQEVDGVVTELAGPQEFAVVDLGGGTLPWTIPRGPSSSSARPPNSNARSSAPSRSPPRSRAGSSICGRRSSTPPKRARSSSPSSPPSRPSSTICWWC